ncbi:MAG: thiopeptide-type bacteriocin biosynthesis protein, partial [Flavobacterium sp.]
ITTNVIPQHIYVSEGDNKLLIDTENEILLGLLFESAKKHKIITIKECLYDIYTDYADNEVVIPFVNTTHKENHYISKKTEDIKSKFIPAEEWLYYKIYTGVKTANKILIDAIQPLVALLKEKGLIKKWFFIRYRDTDFHLRIRFAFDENVEGSVQEIMTLFNEYLKFYVENHMIWKVELATYDKELERYQGKIIELSEKIFHYDSELALQLIDATQGSENEDLLWMLTFKCIDSYFNLFHFTNEERHAITESLYNAFQQEFDADKNVRKQVDLKFRNYLPTMKVIFSPKSEEYTEYISLIDDAMSKIAANCWEMNRLHKTQAMTLIDSFIHMHINRITKSNPRTHELVIYGILEKYYRMKLAQIKHLKVECL